jgi:V8-like Glu-specific endopeptidase
MSHNTGTIQTLVSPITIGPDSGDPSTSPNTWALDFAHTLAPSGSKFVILHFTNVVLPANNRLEVDLGYDSQTDIFSSADGSEFWTRPVNIYALPGANVPIRYITDGAPNGAVQLDRYGRGERLTGDPGPPTLSNSDPFQTDATYLEPVYDPYWFCNTPPNWENINCVGGGDIREQVSQSVGMIVTVHADGVSTCSVTCIGPDLVITAGHCMPDPDIEVPSSSVVFNYQTDCDGDRPAGYEARFFKVLALKKYRWTGSGGPDYCILQLKVPPGGIGVPAIPMRNDIPPWGEQIFGIHHPNGAVKKLSIPNPGYATISSSGAFINVNLDVSGGSSGSGLFDTMGQIVGVLSTGFSCSLNYYSTSAILQDIAATPSLPNSRDVMIVFDRSGSMSSSAGTGSSKIEEARDAASLFVQLIRNGSGNEIGLVSFSSSATTPVDFALTTVTNAVKNSLVGPAPYSSGIVGGLTPGGATSIGDGLDAARSEFPAPGPDPRTILLLTDGLQNTLPMIESIEPSLSGIDVNVIGFGTEASLDGALLNQLAQNHDGMYTRAGTGLELKKFFALAFGNIFESGALVDPMYFMPKSQNEAKPISLSVCGEETITVVVGWDTSDATLVINVKSPSGNIINAATAGVEHAAGRTWVFLRIPLPLEGDRDGNWEATISRAGGSVEFPPPAVDVQYFVNVLAKGGPRLRRLDSRKIYYTGDTINPLIKLEYTNETTPSDATATVIVSKPSASTGTVLTQSKLTAAEVIDADTIPARYATLMKLERDSGKPVVEYVQQTHQLLSDPANTAGAFNKNSGLFGLHFEKLLTIEGNYTFHARTQYGQNCSSTRELFWSVHVEIGIDPDNTDITTSVIDTLVNGNQKVNVTLTPRDEYANHLGPGKADRLIIDGISGSTVIGGIVDNSDGTYSVIVEWDPDSDQSPGVSIGQPGRVPVIVESDNGHTESHDPHWWLIGLLIFIILILLILLIL